MEFEYSAFEINQIISELQKRNITLSFEKVEQLYQAFDDIFPTLLNAKVRSKKFFRPLMSVTHYDCDTSKSKRVANYNLYSDSGVIFDDKNRTDIQHIIDFLEFYYSLRDTYFFDCSNTFGTIFTPDLKYISKTEYNLNYIPLSVFVDDELKKFVSYMPKFLQFCPEEITDLKSYDMGLSSITVNSDSTPLKFDFFISKQNIVKFIGDYEHDGKDEVSKIIESSSFDSNMKIGMYFLGSEQNKWSLSIGFSDNEKAVDELNIHDTLKEEIKNKKESSFVYEIIWNDKKIDERNILLYKTQEIATRA